MGALASSKPYTEIAALLKEYQVCAATEGKSPRTIAIVTSSVRYLEGFLSSHGSSTDATRITHLEIRAFILYLRQKPCFDNHPLTPAQNHGLSGHTISCYVRSIRAFFSWLVDEDILATSPFQRIKMPPPPRKVIPTFSESQLKSLLDAIDTATPEGYRNYTMILMMLDSGLRVSELTSL